MNKSFVITIISSIISGIFVLLLDKLLFPNKNEIVIGILGLLIIISFISILISISVYATSIFFNSENAHFSFKILLSSCIFVTFFFIYQIFPTFYYREICNELMHQMIQFPNEQKLSVLNFVNRSPIEKIHPDYPHVLENMLWISAIIKKKEILTSIAYIHPTTSTAPIKVNSYVMPNISEEVKRNGIYLKSKYSEAKITLLPKLKYKLSKSEEALFLSPNEAKSIFKKKYSFVETQNFVLCPQKENYLLVVEDAKQCKPLTDLVIMDHLSNSKDKFWFVYDLENEKSLISPLEYRKPNHTIVRLYDLYYKYFFRENKKFVTKDLFYIRFIKFDKSIDLHVIINESYKNFVEEDEENWIVLDDVEIIEPDAIYKTRTDKNIFLSYCPLSEAEIKKIISAKKMSIHLKMKKFNDYVNLLIPLTYFEVAFQKFLKL